MRKKRDTEQVPEVPMVVKKATQAIESRSRVALSLGAQKLFNSLLFLSYEKLLENDEHFLSVSDLQSTLGISSRDYEMLKTWARELVGTTVEFDFLKRGSKNKRDWGIYALLSEFDITQGVVRFRWTPKVRPLLHRPETYASLDLKYQRKFSSAYSLRLYELCARFVGVHRTGFLALAVIKDLLGVPTASGYYSSYKNLKGKILKPAIEQVNELTNLEIVLEESRVARQVVEVNFTIVRKAHREKEEARPLPDLAVVGSPTELLLLRMKALGVRRAEAQAIVGAYPADYVDGNLKVVEQAVSLGKVKSPAAYFVAAIEQDYRKIVVVSAVTTSTSPAQGALFEQKVQAIRQEDQDRLAAEIEQREQVMRLYSGLGQAEKDELQHEFIGNNSVLKKLQRKGVESPVLQNMFRAWLVNTWYTRFMNELGRPLTPSDEAC